MEIAEGPYGGPAMLVTARAGVFSADGTVFVVAVDLETGALLWKHQVPGPSPVGTPMGQFPLVDASGGRRAVVFSTKAGIRGIVGPLPRYERKLTLRRWRGGVRGRVTARLAGCRIATVKLVRERPGGSRKMAETPTNARGRWRIEGRFGAGRYLAKVARSTEPGGVCRAARSRPLRR
jgi:hypothetical protein